MSVDPDWGTREKVDMAYQSLDLIESRLAGPDSVFQAWAGHVAVIRDGLDSLAAALGLVDPEDSPA